VGDVTLKRGVTGSTDLFEWLRTAIAGASAFEDISAVAGMDKPAEAAMAASSTAVFDAAALWERSHSIFFWRAKVV